MSRTCITVCIIYKKICSSRSNHQFSHHGNLFFPQYASEKFIPTLSFGRVWTYSLYYEVVSLYVHFSWRQLWHRYVIRSITVIDIFHSKPLVVRLVIDPANSIRSDGRPRRIWCYCEGVLEVNSWVRVQLPLALQATQLANVGAVGVWVEKYGRVFWRSVHRGLCARFQ